MSRSRRELLTDAQLANILENLSSSEDDFEDFSDTDSIADPEYIPEDENSPYEIQGNIQEFDDDAGERPVENESIDEVANQPSTSRSSKIAGNKKKSTPLVWHKKNLQIDDDALNFKGSSDLPSHILDLETPYDFFSYFFTDNFVSHITNETNLYSVQKNPNRSAKITNLDIKKFLGVCIYMSVSHLPRTRCYWRQDIGIPTIRNAMSINEFERLKTILHFNDNNKMLPKDDPQYDNLHKIRPLIIELNKQFSSIPMECKLSLDEQICSTKGRHHLKQYNPMKPHKWGFKLFMLCDTSGFSYNFEIYNGASNFFTRLQPGEQDLGASSNIVVRLARIIPKNKNYQLYCDNYYTSIPLFETLTNQGIFMLGTIRRNRISNNPLKPENLFKKEPRGTSEEYVTNINGVDLSVVSWNDNKVVTLISSCFGELPHNQVQRFDKKENKKNSIPRPHVIQEYNKHMGGVDLLDSHIGRYKIPLR